jgi:hypothetical protein
MKNLLLFLLLFVVSILFTGCPYTSNVPIDKPNMKIVSSYLGVWSETNVSTIRYDIKRLNDFEYLIIQLPDTTSRNNNSFDNDTEQSDDVKKSSDTTTYTGHISKIKDFYFLNLKSKGENFLEANKYNIFKIDFTGSSEFRLTEITSNIKEQFDNPDDLKNYIEKYMDSGISFFYGSETTYLKEK